MKAKNAIKNPITAKRYIIEKITLIDNISVSNIKPVQKLHRSHPVTFIFF